jgi:hypothetical protein
MWRREDVIEQLKKKQGEQSLRSFAQTLGCSAPYLSDIYNGNRDPGPLILNELGLERRVETIVTYVKRRWR